MDAQFTEDGRSAATNVIEVAGAVAKVVRSYRTIWQNVFVQTIGWAARCESIGFY
jgi:hypothetical protein